MPGSITGIILSLKGAFCISCSIPKLQHRWDDVAKNYVVYRFAKGEKVNLDDPSKIVAITNKTYYELPYRNGETKYTYVVTALDRLQNESKGKKAKVKL